MASTASTTVGKLADVPRLLDESIGIGPRIDRLKSGDRLAFSGVWGSLRGVLAAALARKTPHILMLLPEAADADTVAGDVAAALGSEKVIFLTDVDGLSQDVDDPGSLISALVLEEARAILDSGTLSSGMIPKVRACVEALDAGVHRAHVLNGTVEHALLLEVFTDEGVGTMITHPGEES